MQGNEFWTCELHNERFRYTLHYDGQNIELFAKLKENEREWALILPPEILDRFTEVWQQWRGLSATRERGSADE